MFGDLVLGRVTMVRVLFVCCVFALFGAPAHAAMAGAGDTGMVPLAKANLIEDTFPALLTAWRERYRPLFGPPKPGPGELGLQLLMVLALTALAARVLPRRRHRRQGRRS